MALAQDTDLLLLDEPTTFLDINHQVELLRLLRTLNEQSGKTIVAVLHDLNLASRFCDHIIAMADGSIVAVGTGLRARGATVIDASRMIAMPGFVMEMAGRPGVLPGVDADSGRNTAFAYGRRSRTVDCEDITTDARLAAMSAAPPPRRMR